MCKIGKKLIFLGSSCIYPKNTSQPIREDSLLTGPLESTNEAYALAKISGVKLCEYIREKHGLNYFSFMPTNLYGPGDNFDLENSHVPAALLRKFHVAKINNLPFVKVWGTGTPMREFMHVDDLSDAIWFTHQNPPSENLVNVGTGSDISIAEFANVKNGQSETILLHEILHALSYKALRNNNEFNKDFKKLYDSTIEQLGMYNAESLEGLYGTYTIDEFFVALFTDSKFIKELENLAPIDIKNYNNMFEEIFDYILKLLNITKNSSLYSQAFSVASNILEDTNNQTSMIDSVDNINDNSLNYNKPEGLPAIDRTSTECS